MKKLSRKEILNIIETYGFENLEAQLDERVEEEDKEKILNDIDTYKDILNIED